MEDTQGLHSDAEKKIKNRTQRTEPRITVRSDLNELKSSDEKMIR